MYIGPQNVKWVTWPWPRPFQGWFVIRRLGLATDVPCQPMYHVWGI